MSEQKVSLTNQPPMVPPPAAEVDYRPPTDAVPLPSKGAVYPPEHPLHGQEAVEIKSMTAREEDILTSPALLKQGKALSTLIRSCLLNKTIDPDELLSGDRNAILTAIRITGYGPQYDVEVSCPACDEKVKHTFDLRKLTVVPLGAEPTVPGTNCFEFTLPVTNRICQFKLMTGASEREVSAAQESARRKLGPSAEAPVTSRLFYHIMSIGGETDRTKLQRLVQAMPAGDSRALRSHMEKISPGVDMQQSFICPACSVESEVDVPMGTEFFWPSG